MVGGSVPGSSGTDIEMILGTIVSHNLLLVVQASMAVLLSCAVSHFGYVALQYLQHFSEGQMWRKHAAVFRLTREQFSTRSPVGLQKLSRNCGLHFHFKCNDHAVVLHY